MLDIQFIRDQSESVKEACRNKQLSDKVVNELLSTDSKRRELIVRVEEIRQEINANANKIKAQVGKGNKPEQELIQHGKDLKEQLKEVEPNLKELESKFNKLILQIPNVPADGVPVGVDEGGNQVVRKAGELPKFDFEPRTHDDLLESLNLLDTKRGVKIAGFRGYFLKNDGLLLEQALLQYAQDLLRADGFDIMSVPNLVNEEMMVGTGYFPWGSEDHYQTQDGQVLAGTAEVALTAYHAKETLAEKDLPIKMAGISTCYRREVGAHGQDTKGIIRVHQFNKVEQVIYTIADEKETISWHETLLGNAENLLQSLKLPYQVLLMCTGDMGAGQRKKYDVETWFPSQNKYRETHSCSYFNDFQARRLSIKYQAKDGNVKHVYTMNNTMAASPRLLAAIIENYQQPDGSIKVPEVLKKYVGKSLIEYL